MLKTDFILISYFVMKEGSCSGREKEENAFKILLLPIFVLEGNETIHVWKNKQLFSTKAVLAKLTALMTGFPERPRAERSLSCPVNLGLNGHDIIHRFS